MALGNLMEYGKIGMGMTLASIGLHHDHTVTASRQAMENAMYRGLEVVNPETLVNAHSQLEQYLNNNMSGAGISFALFCAGLTVVGAGILTSGIYNLAKNYRKETKE